MLLNIVYELDRRNGQFIAHIEELGQEIAVWKNHFRRALEIHPQTVAGCCEIDARTAERIGFLIPSPLKKKMSNSHTA